MIHLTQKCKACVRTQTKAYFQQAFPVDNRTPNTVNSITPIGALPLFKSTSTIIKGYLGSGERELISEAIFYSAHSLNV